jgi:hypothetical protein
LWTPPILNENVTLTRSELGIGRNITWMSTGLIAGEDRDDGRTVQFRDINGDGRWEYLDVNSAPGASYCLAG